MLPRGDQGSIPGVKVGHLVDKELMERVYLLVPQLSYQHHSTIPPMVHNPSVIIETTRS